MSPRKILESAAELAGLELEKCKGQRGDMWRLTSHHGNDYSAFIDEKNFSLFCYIADLDQSHSDDAEFLFRLLRWQGGMMLVRFRITKEDALFLEYRRSFEDLDVSEACQALLGMSEAVDSYVARLKEYLEA